MATATETNVYLYIRIDLSSMLDISEQCIQVMMYSICVCIFRFA